jgi:hypothetical protein
VSAPMGIHPKTPAPMGREQTMDRAGPTRIPSDPSTTALKGHKKVAGGWSEALPPERRPQSHAEPRSGFQRIGKRRSSGTIAWHFCPTRPRIALVDWTRIPPPRPITAVWNPSRGSGPIWGSHSGGTALRNPRLPSGTPSGTTCRDQTAWGRGDGERPNGPRSAERPSEHIVRKEPVTGWRGGGPLCPLPWAVIRKHPPRRAENQLGSGRPRPAGHPNEHTVRQGPVTG